MSGVTALRVQAYPDGGIARVRALGTPTTDGMDPAAPSVGGIHGGIPVTAPSIRECTGLWRRTLLIEADGSRDTGTGVLWLQGITAYVDSRGFAGRLHQLGDVFEWQPRRRPRTAGPVTRRGSMRWDGDVLVETGVHADYVEHWVRGAGSSSPCWSMFLTSETKGAAVLVRVGERFGWASAARVVIDTVGTPRWTALGLVVDGGALQANGVAWRIERSEGNVNL